MSLALGIFYSLSFTVFSIGLLTLGYYPLSLIFALRKPRPALFKSGPDPLVSVIVPGYNESKVVGNCVESILASDYPNFEIILVDDGSTDDTLSVMHAGQPQQVAVIIFALTQRRQSLCAQCRHCCRTWRDSIFCRCRWSLYSQCDPRDVERFYQRKNWSGLRKRRAGQP